jgi:hypothetical protein
MTRETRAGWINCLACGEEMAPVLWQAGSLRCHDCREVGAPLRIELVELALGSRPALRVVTGVPRTYTEEKRPLAA